MSRARLVALTLVLAACLAAVRPTAQQPQTTVDLLDRYAKGEFAEVVTKVAALEKLGDLLKDLKRDDVKAWLDAGGPDDRGRRELAAATFALEAARTDEWHEWKSIINNPIGPPNVYWMPPPLLIEWGCELLRKHEEPLPTEPLWQLAALSVAERGEDTQFLIGFTELAPSPPPPATGGSATPPGAPGAPGAPPAPRPSPLDSLADEVANVNKQIEHLNHVMARFPAEKRFVLGEALIRERPGPADAIKLYKSLLDDPDVGPEAAVRLGALYLRNGDLSNAIQQFDHAERSTRNPDLIYLARYHRGQALVKSKKDDEAIDAFRMALIARPASQSASSALAALLVKAERYSEAQALMKVLLDADPHRSDPNMEYMHGDDRFWPYWIGQLHAAIVPKSDPAGRGPQ